MLTNDVLKKLRLDAKYTQAELARKLGISQQMIAYWETGRSKPAVDMLLKLAQLYNVSVDYILRTEKSQEPTKIQMLVKTLLADRPDILKFYEDAATNIEIDESSLLTTTGKELLKNCLVMAATEALQTAKTNHITGNVTVPVERGGEQPDDNSTEKPTEGNV